MAIELDYMEYADDDAAQVAYVSNDSWNLLNEDCTDISDWIDGDIGTAVSEVSPAGQFRFDTNAGAAGNAYAYRYRTITSPPNKFVIEMKTYFDTLGTKGNNDYMRFDYHTDTWKFIIFFASDGLFTVKAGGVEYEIGTDIVKHGGSAAWQIWRFEVDKSGGESSATVEVFLDDVSQGTFDCDYETDGADGRCSFIQRGHTTDDIVSHLDYIKIGELNLQCYSEDTIKEQGDYSLKAIAKITNSLNDTLTHTVDPTIDLSNLTEIKFDIRASRIGSNIKIGIHDSGGTTTEHTANIASADVFQTETWDISGVSNANKNTIDSIIITIVNADAGNTFYIDGVYAFVILKLAGTSANAITASGNLSIILNLLGTSANIISTTGSFAITLDLAGTSVNVFSTIAELTLGIVEKISGTSASTLSTIGAINLILDMAGTSANAISTVGSFSITLDLKGISINTISTIGNLGIILELLGISVNAISTTGEIGITLALTGTSENVFTAISTIELFVPIWTKVDEVTTTWLEKDKGELTWTEQNKGTFDWTESVKSKSK